MICQNLEHALWYAQEAACWDEALPIGNGRIGAMVFGGIARERIALNEDTLWSGYPVCGDRPGAGKYLPVVRDLMLQGQFHKAQTIIEQKMQGADTQFYLPLGDLILDFPHMEQPAAYSRGLSLRDAVAETGFELEGAAYRRETFVSAPDQALYLRLTASKPGALNFSCLLQSKLRHRCAAQKNGIRMDGICPGGMADRPNPAVYALKPAHKGMRFAVRMDLQTDGKLRAAKSGKLAVSGATTAVLRLFARTSFNGFNRHPFTQGRDEQALCAADQAAAETDFDKALRRHIADHRALYDRCELHLENDSGLIPTDKRLESHAAGQDDDALYALLFHYGRYLLITGSRAGTQPMNLQGIWNEHLCAPWRGNYTVNINTEMNYWPAEICNLSECHQPLFQMISELLATGARTAQSLYGARGAAVHHNTDLWRLSNPVSRGVEGSAEWAFWPMALGWLTSHMTAHYRYTRDAAFLREQALPAQRACARFYLDALTDIGGGRLSILPATSPENTFYHDGRKTAVAKSAQMNTSIVRQVFTQYLETLDILGIAEDMQAEVRSALPLLPEYQTGPHGELLEWDAPYKETDPHHRHVSHLYALFPDQAISLEHTPALAAACRRVLERRGDESTGWSMGWKVNLWACLQEGDHALKLLTRQLHPLPDDGTGGTYPNFLGGCPPFQIDGNFGACSGIARMLVQGDDHKIHILPAIPGCWTGYVRGLCLPGGTQADIRFAQGRLTEATIRFPAGQLPPTVVCQGLPADSRVTLRPINS